MTTNTKRRLKRFAVITAAAAIAAVVLGTTTASAHTGQVNVDQTCTGWTASVDLHENTTSDRTVTVESTIPGTTGTTWDGQTYGEIWSASGTGDGTVAGTVTLTISDGEQDEFTDSASLVPAEGCPPPPPVDEPPVIEPPVEEPPAVTVDKPAPPAVATPGVEPVLPMELAYTGASTPYLLVIAAFLIALGLYLLRAAERIDQARQAIARRRFWIWGRSDG